MLVVLELFKDEGYLDLDHRFGLYVQKFGISSWKSCLIAYWLWQDVDSIHTNQV